MRRPTFQAPGGQHLARRAGRLLLANARRPPPILADVRPGEGGFWYVGPRRAEEFVARGYRLRHFFPHDVFWLPKCCREVDYRIKGYRRPHSRMTAQLTDENLLWHNFECLAASPHAVGEKRPKLRFGLVRFPISLDDFPPYRGATGWAPAAGDRHAPIGAAVIDNYRFAPARPR